MKDNEIIKALECCKGIPTCDCCPYLKKCGKLTGDALDLINRQKAYIDDLTRDTVPKLKAGLERANKYGVAADKENEQLKAEIKRLTEYNENLLSANVALSCDLLDEVKCVRAEAIKEFAERLKATPLRFRVDYITNYDKPAITKMVLWVDDSDINNIAKAMTEENRDV